jgi:hypothetical protein
MSAVFFDPETTPTHLSFLHSCTVHTLQAHKRAVCLVSEALLLHASSHGGRAPSNRAKRGLQRKCSHLTIDPAAAQAAWGGANYAECLLHLLTMNALRLRDVLTATMLHGVLDTPHGAFIGCGLNTAQLDWCTLVRSLCAADVVRVACVAKGMFDVHNAPRGSDSATALDTGVALRQLMRRPTQGMRVPRGVLAPTRMTVEAPAKRDTSQDTDLSTLKRHGIGMFQGRLYTQTLHRYSPMTRWASPRLILQERKTRKSDSDTPWIAPVDDIVQVALMHTTRWEWRRAAVLVEDMGGRYRLAEVLRSGMMGTHPAEVHCILHPPQQQLNVTNLQATASMAAAYKQVEDRKREHRGEVRRARQARRRKAEAEQAAKMAIA